MYTTRSEDQIGRVVHPAPAGQRVTPAQSVPEYHAQTAAREGQAVLKGHFV